MESNQTEQNKIREKQDKCKLEIIASSVLTVFSIAVLIGSIQIWVKKSIVNSPGIFPTIVSAILLGCSVAIFVEAIIEYRKISQGVEIKSEGRIRSMIRQELPFRTWFTIVMTVLYAIGFGVFGFYISTAVFLLSTMLVYEKGKKVKRTLLVTGSLLLGVYLIIDKIFGVHF